MTPAPSTFSCGHPRTPDNTDSGGGIYKRCRICHRRNREKYVKAKQARESRQAVWSMAIFEVWR